MSSNIQKTMVRRNTPFSVWHKKDVLHRCGYIYVAYLYIDVKKTGFTSRKK